MLLGVALHTGHVKLTSKHVDEDVLSASRYEHVGFHNDVITPHHAEQVPRNKQTKSPGCTSTIGGAFIGR